MKKFNRIIWGGIAAVAIGGFATFNVGFNSLKGSSTIHMANVEALTSCESPVLHWHGQTITLKCENSSGEKYDLPACDFDDAYINMCNGRSKD
jgi:hypothetical protein